MQEEVFIHPTAMEPLLPETKRLELAGLTCQILLASGRLTGLCSSLTREKVSTLIEGMNSYYSNLIEGHRTKPKDIERALKDDFSHSPRKKENQLLSRAHIEVEKLMKIRLQKEDVEVYAPEFICWLHQEFYQRLPDEMRWATTKNGRKYKIQPGILRDFMVDVGHHIPPHHDSLPAFMERFGTFYRSDKILPTNRWIAIASAHHRLAWIHPFGDGNGRVTRLHSHALLIKHGLDGGGLWTLSRGLARHRERYYELLAGADCARIRDSDGRGNLTDVGLSDFCKFFLETALDQIQFMSDLLELGKLRKKIDHYFQSEAPLDNYKEEIARLINALVIEGEISREQVQMVTGRKHTTCSEIIRIALKNGWAESPSPKGRLQIAFPAKMLDVYFPRLFLELPGMEES